MARRNLDYLDYNMDATLIKTVHYTVNYHHCLVFVLLESCTNMRDTYCYVGSVYRSVISWFWQAMLTRKKHVSILLFQLLTENEAENIGSRSLHVKYHSPVYSPQDTAWIMRCFMCVFVCGAWIEILYPTTWQNNHATDDLKKMLSL